MTFIKYVDPLSHQKPLTDCPVAQIKISSRGLVGEDRAHFVKRAGNVFDHIKLTELIKPGEVAIHVIALGCDEYYGPNRNGDAFTKEACSKYHITFEKLGHWFRNHNHNDPSKSYGLVKASAYNMALGRIELIVALNGTKEAAARNGGLVADLELDRLTKGEDLPVSMACRVAYDQCSGCGNRARNREEYCTEKTCKYGGLKKNMGKTFDDGHTLRAFNPQPYFFDISYVPIPADRIAYTLGQIKVGKLQTGNVPLWLYREPTQEEVLDQLQWLGKLAYWELQANRGFVDKLPLTCDVKIAGADEYEVNELTYELSKQDICLQPNEFLCLFAGLEPKIAGIIANKMKPFLKTVFSELASNSDIMQILERNIFYPREPLVKHANLIITETRKNDFAPQSSFMFKQAEAIILSEQKLKKLASIYALYQLASLTGWQGTLPKELVCKQIIAINHLGE